MFKSIKLKFSETAGKIRFNLSANNNPIFIGYYKHFYKPKPASINAFLDEYSRSKASNFSVIQIGANDGITHDPIHKFIKRDKWKGVLLEPQPYVHEHFLKKIYRKNDGIHTLCAALGTEDGSMKLFKIAFCNMRWATGLASFQRENLEKAFTSGLVQKKCAKYNITIPEQQEACISHEDVMVLSPQTLLKQYNLPTIDLLQIDVEGYDAEIIRIFEIEKTQPRAIIFEHSHLSTEEHDACIQHLVSNQYSVKKYGANTLAMLHPSDEFKKYF